MRRMYFVNYGNFANAYNLMYAENEDQLKCVPKTAEHITRREAEKLAADERRRRKTNGAFSGYADHLIYPADYNPKTSWYQYYHVEGCMVERTK